MQIVNQKLNGKTTNPEKLKDEVKKKYPLEGNALYKEGETSSEVFEKDNAVSERFSILKINLERATLREASSFKEFVEKSISEDGRNLIIDLNSCEFVDSSFFGVLVDGLKRMQSMGMKFYMVYDSTDKLPIFSATGLDKVFTVFTSIQDAINN